MRAQVIGGIPGDLVGSLTGLTQGRFPVRAKATYAGALKKADRKTKGANAAVTVESDETPPQHRDLRQGRLARDRRQRRQGRQARREQAPRPLRRRPGRLRQHVHLRAPRQRRQDLPVPEAPHQEGRQRHRQQAPWRPPTTTEHEAAGRRQGRREAAPPTPSPPPPPPRSPRSACSPTRSARTPSPPAATPSSRTGGEELASAGAPLGLNPKDFVAKRLVKGARILGGTTLGRIGKTTETKAPHLLFEIRPAGRGAPRIDPKPILDGWKLLESHRGLPRQGQERALRLRRRGALDRPDHADEQGDARPPRARRPPHRALRLRPRRHPLRRDRPPRAGHARVPRQLRPEADRLRASSAATAT